ncbi:MAG: OmpA family protein [Melioribacteraceae bacterium]
MLKIKHYTILFVLLCFSSSIFSQLSKNYYHPLSNSLVLTLGVGSNYPFSDYETPKLGWLANGGIEYYFSTRSNHIFGIGINGGLQNVSSELNHLGLPKTFDTQIINGGLKLIYSYSLQKKFFPFVSFEGSYNLYNFETSNVKSRFFNYSNGGETNSLGIDIETGLKYKVSDQVSLDFSVGYNYVLNDNIDAIEIGEHKDFFVTGQVGISFTLWNNVDSDSDGIPDDKDQCPNEAEDMDGFQDEDGCPDYDNDGDGILDINDGCQNAKEDFDGYKDEDGCPDIDNDGDGILDINDKCPNSKEDMDGFEDEDGCPEVDNDNDGILDINDSCPNESEVFNGYKDDDGCPDEAPAATYYEEPIRKKVVKRKTRTQKNTTKKTQDAPAQFLVHGESTFLSGSGQIKSSAFSNLNRIVNLMKQDPNARWSIEAHVDRSKTTTEAIRISKSQATAIMNYFISKGLSASNFRAIGKGDSSPVASNNSVYGRMKNRRIIVKKIN